MAELIRKDKLIDWTYRVPKYYDSMNDRTDMRDFINELPTTTEAEIRHRAIDEFAEKLKAVIEKDLENPDLMLDCKKCGIWKAKGIDEIAEQLKGE